MDVLHGNAPLVTCASDSNMSFLRIPPQAFRCLSRRCRTPKWTRIITCVRYQGNASRVGVGRANQAGDTWTDRWVVSFPSGLFLCSFGYSIFISFFHIFFSFFKMFSGCHTWSHDVEAVSMSTLGLHGNSSHAFECLDSTVVRGRWSNKLVLHIGGINLVSATKPCSTLWKQKKTLSIWKYDMK